MRKTYSFAELLVRAVERCGIFEKNLQRPFRAISDWINHMRISEAKWGEISNDIKNYFDPGSFREEYLILFLKEEHVF